MEGTGEADDGAKGAEGAGSDTEQGRAHVGVVMIIQSGGSKRSLRPFEVEFCMSRRIE